MHSLSCIERGQGVAEENWERRGKMKHIPTSRRVSGFNAHLQWEKTRGNQNECEREKQIRHRKRQHSIEWWNGWLERSDSWREEMGDES